MKETNLNTINETASQLLDELQPRVMDYIDKWRLTAFLSMAYINNNLGKETTVRSATEGYMTVIIYEQGVSVISDDGVTRHSSRIKTDYPLCLYEDIITDLQNIISIIDATIHRLGL